MTHKLPLALLAAAAMGCSHTRVDPYANLPAPSHVLRVPAQYNTIQAAVTAATPGDRILVSPGTYPWYGGDHRCSKEQPTDPRRWR